MKALTLMDSEVQIEVIKAISDYSEGKEVNLNTEMGNIVWLLIQDSLDLKRKLIEGGKKSKKISKGSTKKTTPKTTTPKEEISEKLPNEDIDKCIELVKSFNNGIINDSQKKGRWFANHLINKLSKLDSVISGNYTRYETLEILLKIVSENKFYQNKISSVESIYRNLATLMQVCKGDVKKQTQQIVLTAL